MNTADKQKALIGAVVLVLIIAGLVIWYMATNPPKPIPFGQIPEPTQEIPEGAFRKEMTVDEGQYHTAVAAYPAETPLRDTAGAEADARVVAGLKAFGEEEIRAFKENSGLEDLTQEDIEMLGFDQGRKYTLEMDFEVSESPKTLTYVYTIYADTLGAHPNGYYRTFTFDKATGAEVSLNNLFTGSYLQRLSEISRQKLPAVIATKTGYEANLESIEIGTTANIENFRNFALQGNNLIVIFAPYQVGPYAIGPQFLEIPLTEISDVLNPAYRP